MASPVDAGRVATAFAAVTPWVVPLPAGIVAGDLLIMYLRTGGAATFGALAGWSGPLVSDTSDATDDTTYVLYRWADGTEGTTASPAPSPAVKGAAIVWRITGAADPSVQPPQVSAVQVFTAANAANAPAISPNGGSKDYLFLACIGLGGVTAPTGYPAGYAPVDFWTAASTGGSAATNCVVAYAKKAATTATEDTGAWTHAAPTTGGCAFTIAIHPGLPPQIKAVGGVASAQSFGVPSAYIFSDPSSLSGLAVWLDADEASTFSYSSGTLISQWRDKSPRGNHVAQATPANQPSRSGSQNGRTTVDCVGAVKLDRTAPTERTIGDTYGLTVLAVFKKKGANNGTESFPVTLVASNQPRPFDAYNETCFTPGQWGWGPLADDVRNTTTWKQWAFVLQSPGATQAGGGQLLGRHYVNGVKTGADYVATTWSWLTASQVLTVASRNDNATQFTGEIAEIVVYDRNLSDTERKQVEAYLYAKWLALPPQIVPVAGVAPAAFDPHIVGEFLAGQATVGYTAGTPQFGTVTTTISAAVPTFGVTSAQSFGAVTALSGPVTKPAGGVSSAQSFGVPVIAKGAVLRAVNGIASAQAFGTPVPKAVISKPAGGVPTAQAFGTPVPKAVISKPLGGVSTAQSFGVPTTIKGFVTVAVGAVASAQSFGTVVATAGGIPTQVVPVLGIDPGGFNPKSITGLAVWLDASQLGLADGAAVSSWPNLNGANPTVIGTPVMTLKAGASPNGKPAVRFSANQGALRGAWATNPDAYTIMYVVRRWGAGTGRAFTAQYPPSNFIVGFHSSGQNLAYNNGVFIYGANNTWPSTPPDPWKLYGADSTVGTDFRFFIDGVYNGGNAGSPGGLTGGWALSGYADASDPTETMDCDIGELVIYDHRLTLLERTQVENYLLSKWIAVGHDPRFGVPTLTVSAPLVNIFPAGVTSAQAFGTPVLKATFTRTVTGLGSAQGFGTITFRTAVSRAVTGLGSAQSFGAPTFGATIPPQTVVVTGRGSAQSFGAPATKSVIVKLVGGVASAQAFAAPTPVPRTTVPVAGKTSAQAFGIPVVGGGSVAQTVAVPGVPPSLVVGRLYNIVGQSLSGQKVVGYSPGGLTQFGYPFFKTTVRVQVAGLGSAQQFGSVWITFPQVVPVRGVSPGLVYHICGMYLCGQALCGYETEIGYQQIGKPRVVILGIRPSPPEDLILYPTTPGNGVLVPSVPAGDPWLLIPTTPGSIVLTPSEETEEEDEWIIRPTTEVPM
jgi:hypothetical protein